MLTNFTERLLLIFINSDTNFIVQNLIENTLALIILDNYSFKIK